MIANIDRETLMSIVELYDTARAAGERLVAARGGPAACVLSLDDADMVPTALTPEEQSLHDRLGGLDDDTMAQVLAFTGPAGRRPGSRWTTRSTSVMLTQAEHNLDHAALYLTAKPDLGEAIRTAMAILGV